MTRSDRPTGLTLASGAIPCDVAAFHPQLTVVDRECGLPGCQPCPAACYLMSGSLLSLPRHAGASGSAEPQTFHPARPPHRAPVVCRRCLGRRGPPVRRGSVYHRHASVWSRRPTVPLRCLVSAAWAPTILLSPQEVPLGPSAAPGPRGPADPSGTHRLQMSLSQPQLAPDTGPRSGSQSPPGVSATFRSPMGQDLQDICRACMERSFTRPPLSPVRPHPRKFMEYKVYLT
ncbi:hypothetical protein NDU88_001342 [Pleurodeles waltl]|uniref:Uncharacterized protein n=1 Tax=Pleurodeles waltl TaxID=8319 RepID=A0AAV7M2W3_PLEWA|nr:hypothetical protein NDU88_001342 [Pleurodeles waltl]